MQNMTISESIDGSPTSYNITYSNFASGRICGTFSIPAAICQNGVCHHKSRIASPCSPSDDIAVSVLSTNILGSGPPSQPMVFSLMMADIGANDHSESLHTSIQWNLPLHCGHPRMNRIGNFISVINVIISGQSCMLYSPTQKGRKSVAVFGCT